MSRRRGTAASRSITARASSIRPAPHRAMTACTSLNTYHGESSIGWTRRRRARRSDRPCRRRRAAAATAGRWRRASRAGPRRICRCGSRCRRSEDVVDATRLEQVQREVPPEVHGEEVPAPQSASWSVMKRIPVPTSPRISCTWATAWMAHTSSGLRSTAASPAVVGRVVGTGLLEAERLHPEEEPLVGVVAGERADRTGDPVAEVAASPRKKSSWWPTNSARRSVGCSEQMVEVAGGAVPVAGDPAVDRGRVALLPVVLGAAAGRRVPRAVDVRASVDVRWR